MIIKLISQKEWLVFQKLHPVSDKNGLYPKLERNYQSYYKGQLYVIAPSSRIALFQKRRGHHKVWHTTLSVPSPSVTIRQVLRLSALYRRTS